MPEIDQSNFKKIIVKLERAINKNADLRAKYPTMPMKYIESEADLEEAIKTTTQISALPKCYNILIEMNAHISILSLLEHENTDIALSAITLISELLDEDIDLNIELLLDKFVENDLFNILIRNLKRLDEKRADDKQGIFNILELLESVLSLKPELDEKVFNAIQHWLLARLATKEFDSLKQYCSEILSIILQTNAKVRLKFHELGGLEMLLGLTAAYRKRDPEDSDEIEYMENLFDSLCLCLEQDPLKDVFLEQEGLQLTLIMIKEKKMSRMRALKLLCHCMDYANSVKTFIDLGGLKTIFSVFISDNTKYKSKYKDFSEKEYDGIDH